MKKTIRGGGSAVLPRKSDSKHAPCDKAGFEPRRVSPLFRTRRWKKINRVSTKRIHQRLRIRGAGIGRNDFYPKK